MKGTASNGTKITTGVRRAYAAMFITVSIRSPVFPNVPEESVAVPIPPSVAWEHPNLAERMSAVIPWIL
jgi:hypothetical protein